MSASIALSDLSWSTPDGRPLFSGLTLAFGPDRTGLVGRNGVGKTTLLKLISGVLQAPAGRISVDGTLGVLRQRVQVDPDETVADLFGAREGLALLRHAANGDATVDELGRTDWTLETRLAAALARVGLDADADTRLVTLSGGQRTRAGLAALVFADPDFILGGDRSLGTSGEPYPGWGRLRAMQAGRVCRFVPAQLDVLVRAGPRMAEGATLMARCLNGAAR